MSAGWKIVKTHAGYHVTFQADNNEVLLSSEVLNSLASAEDVPRVVYELLVQMGDFMPIHFSDETLSD